MEGYGFGGKFLRVLKELYKEGTCRVNFREIETDWFGVEEGLKQGCSLSPVLYLAELGERLVKSGLEYRIIEKKSLFAGRVASLEPENWTRQAWNMAERKRLPWVNKIIALAKEVGLGGERVRIGQGTWKAEVKVAVDERDRLKWQEGMGNKSTLEKYRSKEEKRFEEWLDREEGRIVFNIRAGFLGIRNRTGRTAQDKTCRECKEGEVENEQHVVLKCPAYRVERYRMLGKVRRIWGEERWGVWMGREEGEQLKEIVGLFGDPSEVLARTVGEGVRKMMKKEG